MICVFDDFLPVRDALLVRSDALNSNFEMTTALDNEQYRVCVKRMPLLEERLCGVLGRNIDVFVSFYRLDYGGEWPHTLIHADLEYGRYIGIYYLNLEGYGGTNLWTHRETGERDIGSHNADQFKDLAGDVRDLSKWESDTEISMRFNRFATFEACRFHSRWPHCVDPRFFGKSVETGRLIAVMFYN